MRRERSCVPPFPLSHHTAAGVAHLCVLHPEWRSSASRVCLTPRSMPSAPCARCASLRLRAPLAGMHSAGRMRKSALARWMRCRSRFYVNAATRTLSTAGVTPTSRQRCAHCALRLTCLRGRMQDVPETTEPEELHQPVDCSKHVQVGPWQGARLNTRTLLCARLVASACVALVCTVSRAQLQRRWRR